MNRATLSDVLRRWAFRIRKSPAVRKPIINSPFANFLTFEERLAPSSSPIVADTRQLTFSRPVSPPPGPATAWTRYNPVSATDPNDSQRMVLFYTRMNLNGNSFIEGQVSNDGGNTWRPISADPTSGAIASRDIPLNPLSTQSLPAASVVQASPASVVFARNNQFYVIFTQHADQQKTSGRLVVMGYNWANAADASTDPTAVSSRQLYKWFNAQDAALNPTITTNNNLGTYTDPQSGDTWTDPITNRATPAGMPAGTPAAPIYVAWNTNATATTNADSASASTSIYDTRFTTFDPNMIYTQVSSDNCLTFSAPLQVVGNGANNSYFQSIYTPEPATKNGGAAPQIFFSPLGGEAGSQGRIFFMWGRTTEPTTTTVVRYDSSPVVPANLPATAAVMTATTVNTTVFSGSSFRGPVGTTSTTFIDTTTTVVANTGSGITNAIAASTFNPAPPVDVTVRTDFALNVNLAGLVNTAQGQTLTDISVNLGINTFDLRQYAIRLFPPNSTSVNDSILLLQNAVDGVNADLPFTFINAPGFPAFANGLATNNFGSNLRTLGSVINGTTLVNNPGATFSDNAARRINDPANKVGNVELIGFYRPESGLFSSIITAMNNPANAAKLNGAWKLSIYDVYSETQSSPPIYPLRLNNFSITFTTNVTNRLGTDKGNPQETYSPPFNLDYRPLGSGADFTGNNQYVPGISDNTGIGPGISLATDNTVGTNSPTRGFVYMGFTSRENIGDNTNLQVRVNQGHIDGITGAIIWDNPEVQINDDSAADNMSGGNRTQFMPSIASDPMTGALVASWYDARNDASNSRVVRMVGVSVDGGATWDGLQTYLNRPKTAIDAITGEVTVLEPLPDNMTNAVVGPNGFGLRQSIQVMNGKVTPFWTGNQNIQPIISIQPPPGDYYTPTLNRADIFTATVQIGAGPRLIYGDTGPRTTGVTPITANFTAHGVDPDGSQLLSGFKVVFDRPINPATFTRDDVTVAFRSPSQSGLAPTGTVALLDPFELTGNDLSGNPIPANRWFWIPFATPQSAVGTYSYAVGPNIQDWVQSPIGSFTTQFPSTPGSPPTPPFPATKWVVLQPLENAPPPAVPGFPLPPNTAPAPYSAPLTSNTPLIVSGTGDNFSPVLTAPALTAGSFTPVVGEVLVTINMTNSSGNNIRVYLEDNDGLGISVPLTNAAGNNTNTRFADRASLAYTSGAQPWTGDFRPRAIFPEDATRRYATLSSFAGLPLTSVTSWRLRLRDITGANTATLNSWSLQILTGREVDAANPSLGNFMDQDGDGRTLETPGQFSSNPDVFSNPTSTTGTPFVGPFLSTVQPIVLAGPRFVASSSPLQMPNVVSITVSGPFTIDVTFDRAIDRTTFNANGADIFSVVLATPPGATINNNAANTVFLVAPIGGAASVTSFRITLPDPTIANATYQINFRSGADLRTTDNLVYNRPTDNITVTFDREMDPASFTPASIIRMTGPTGDIAGPFTVTPIFGDARSFRVGFPTQVLSGQYTVEIAPGMTSSLTSVGGTYAVDSNLNAGVQVLRGVDPNAAAYLTNNYATTAAPVTIPAQGVVSLPIDVADSFTISQLVAATRATSSLIEVRLNISFPNAPDLSADLIAPDGTRIRLFTRTGTTGGQTNNFIGTIFNDLGVSSIQQGTAPFTGIFLPQFPLSSLNGRGALGIGPNAWRIEVTNNGNSTGTFNNWGLTLPRTVLGTGLGETVADRFTAGFRIYQNESNNPLSQQVWSPTGQNQVTTSIILPLIGRTTATQPIAGRANTVAIDPSDSTGNTVYIGGASGGVWKTTNFLTLDADGPTWTPLTDFGPTFGLNISSLTVIPRNSDPNQTIIIASTGSGGYPGGTAPVTSGNTLPELAGVGLLRSMDGGRTWAVLDSTSNGTGVADNVLAIDAPQGSGAGQRDRLFFNSSVFKVVYDPTPGLNGKYFLYMAVAGNGAQGGIWRSIDTGLTWTRIQANDATDVVLAPGSGANSTRGNLSTLYAALPGQGIYWTNEATSANSLVFRGGFAGTPLVLRPNGSAVTVANSGGPGAALNGRISLAVPALTNDPLQNSFYVDWVYAYATNGAGNTANLFLSRDGGLNWTTVILPNIPNTSFATNNETNPGFNISNEPVRTPTVINGQSGVGNNALSIAVDPQNPNVVYLGGLTSLRVDTTKVNTPQTFVNYDNSRAGQAGATALATSGGLTNTPYTGLLQSGSAAAIYGLDFLNLRRYPNFQGSTSTSTATPFVSNSSLRTVNQNGASFSNTGENAQITPFNNILDAGLRSFSFSDVTQIVPMVDPVSGKTRLIYTTRYGVVSGVDNGDTIGTGTIQSSVGSYQLPANNRNGNLNLQRFYSGATQPSVLAADLAGAFYYGMGQDTGFLASRSGVLNNGDFGWQGTTSTASTGIGVAVDQTGTGSMYQYRLPCCYNTSLPDGSVVPTDFFRYYAPGTSTLSDGISRTLGLVQQGDSPIPSGQWPINRQDIGYFTVNPIDPRGLVMSSQAGRIFRTVDQGVNWTVVAEPNITGASYARAVAFGAPNPNAQVNEYNNFIYVGTQSGRIFVTTVGGGPAGWTEITNAGVVGPILSIQTNPKRGSRDAFAVTPTQVWYIPDSSVAGGWINITGNLFNLRTQVFGDPNSAGTPPAGSVPFDIRSLTSLIADWRYAIPVTPGNPNSATFPILYIGANAGVFRSLDRGATWSFYPQSSTYTEPVSKVTVNIPSGGFLPNTWVTDLDLSVGNVDPLTGFPVAQTGSPNMLVATTYGRGTWTIRLDDPLPQFRITDLSGPKVTSLATTNPSNTLRVRFDGPIDPKSFDPSDIVLTAPSGVAIPITSVSPIVNPNLPLSGDRRDLFEFNFPTQTEVGFYTIKIGEQIFDFAGRAMNQNANLVNGESDDAYTGYVYLNPPGNLQGNLFISMPQVTRAGDPTLVTISAIEGSSTGSTQAGNPLASFNKLISITTTDGQAIIPSSYTFDSTNDRGSKVFSFEFRTAGTQFVSVVDTSGTINPAKAQILVRGGQATSYVVNGFTNPTTAGNVGSITVTAKDSYGNIADGYTGTVAFTSTDSLATLPANSTFTATDNGVRTYNGVVLRSAGVRSIIATDTAKASVTGSQVGIVVNPAAVSQFSVAGLPATITAGTPSTITVTAQDKYGNTNPSYLGTVAFSSTDPQLAVGSGLPTSYTFQPTDNGLATFTNGVTLKTVGSRTVTAKDTVTPAITGTSNPATNVVAAAATGFTISVSPVSPIAGTSFVMIVTAVDPYGNTDTKFTGAVTFSSTDTNSTLPGNYTFVSTDSGRKTFTGVILRTVNTLLGQTITAKDPNTGTPSGTSPTINVQPNVATQLFITNLPANSQAGVPTNFTVVAKDAFGNTATSYTGSVQFTVDDPLISISKYTFNVTDNGLKVLPVTFQSFGLKTITATDFNSPSLTSKATTFVSAGTFAKLSISNLAPTLVAGTQTQFRLTAQDKFGNQVTGYAGTVTFSTSDPLVNTTNGLPGAYSFTAGDNGTALFTTVFRTASTQSISASDSMAGVAGTPATTNVTAAAVNFFNVTGFPSPLIAGKSGSVKVVAVDAFGNTVTNYTGKVSFTSSDPVATLPTISTFTAADQGVRSFTVGLSTPGLQSISVTDTVQTAVKGSQQAIEVLSNVPPTLPPTGGTIGGLVFNDLNNNGVRDTNEPGIGGVTVYLDTNRDNTLNLGEISATTSVQGFFNLTTSVDVTAPVRAVTPTGQVQSTTNPPDTVLTNGVVASGLLFGFRASGGTSPPPVTPPVVPPPPVIPPVTPPIVGNARSPGSNFAVGTSGSAGGTVSVKNQTGVTLRDFIPYAQTSEGGARPAIQRTPQGDRTIVGPGPGGVPDVLVFDNNGGNLTRTLTPFESSFTGGVFVTTGDISSDGYDDIVVSADVGGGPRVQVLNGKTFEVIADFFGIDDPDFRGGARTSLGDFNGDGILDLAVAAGFGGGPRIALFDGRSLVPGQIQQRMVSDFFVFEQTLRNGVYLSAGDVSGDGKADLVLGGGPGGGPRVQIFSGGDLVTGKFTEVGNFFAGNQDNRGGVRVTVKDLDGDQFMDLVVGDGEGAGSQVTAYPGKTLGSNRPNNPLFQFDELSGYTGGVFVG